MTYKELSKYTKVTFKKEGGYKELSKYTKVTFKKEGGYNFLSVDCFEYGTWKIPTLLSEEETINQTIKLSEDTILTRTVNRILLIEGRNEKLNKLGI